MKDSLRKTLLAIRKWMREDQDRLMQIVRRYDCTERLRHEMDGRNLAAHLDVEIAAAAAEETDAKAEASMCAACWIQHGRDGEACGLSHVCHEPVDIWDRVGRPVLDPAFLRPRGVTC
jgi:cytochrome c553